MLQVRQVVRGEKKFEKHCLSTCVDIFNIVSDDADCIVGVHRIGKQGEKRSRLLKVKCKDSESRNRVLRHAKELRKNASSKMFSSIQIALHWNKDYSKPSYKN